MEESCEFPTRNNISEETHWEKAAKTRMGKYLTCIEKDFMFKSNLKKQTCVIMDVGAEAGRFSVIASDKKATVIGIDIDSCGLRRLKLKNENVDVIQADVMKTPLKDGVFDAIFMIEVLDYITMLEVVFLECQRTLKPDGSLIFSFGNKSSLKSKLREFRGRHYRHAYSKVLALLSRSGFMATREIGYSWLPFGRTSESRFIPIFAMLERILGLRKIPSLSPWVIVHGIKSDKPLSPKL